MANWNSVNCEEKWIDLLSQDAWCYTALRFDVDRLAGQVKFLVSSSFLKVRSFKRYMSKYYEV